MGLDARLPESFDRQSMVLEVVIRDLPTLQERGWRFEAEVRQAHWAGDSRQAVSEFPRRGLMFWPASQSRSLPERLRPGERWELMAKVRQPFGTLNPESFDAEAWMLEQGFQFVGSVQSGKSAQTPRLLGIESGFGIRIDQLRDAIRYRIKQAVGDSSAAGVLSALVVGDQRAISLQDWTIFRRTGVSHLMSISGLHVTMIGAMAGWCAGLLWRWLCRMRCAAGLWLPVQSVSAFSAMVAAIGYALLAGFAIPAQRTALMVSVMAVAKIMGVRASSWSVLALALLAVLLTHPMSVLSVGFWLSFVAVGFLFSRQSPDHGQLLDSADHRPLMVTRAVQVVRQAAATQWAITLGLLPLTILLFQQISVVGPLANAIAIPVVSFLVTPFSMAGAIEYAIFDSTNLLGISVMVQETLSRVLVWLSGHRLSTFDWPSPGPLGAAIATFGMVIVFGGLCRGRWVRLRHLGWLGLIPLLISSAPAPAEGEMQVTLMDVGQGSAVLVRTQTHALLFDTGPVMGQGDAGDRVVLPTLRRYGVSALDRIVVSHADQDHSGGLASLLLGLPVRELIAPEFESLDAMLQQAERSPHFSSSMTRQTCRAGQGWQWDGVRFQFLHPQSDPQQPLVPRQRNRYSCVLRIEDAQGGSLLLTGDIPIRTDRELVSRFVGLQDPEASDALTLAGVALASQILVAPHHGSRTSLSEELLRAVAPRMVAIQAGFRNRFGHPHSEVLERIERFGLAEHQVLRTDYQGAIEIRWVGGQPFSWDFWRDHRRYWHLPRQAGPSEDDPEP